jgi:hypothetical protein
MRNLPSSAARGRPRSLAAILLAPAVASLFAVALFTPNWRDATALRYFVMSLVYAYSIGVPVGFARVAHSPAFSL